MAPMSSFVLLPQHAPRHQSFLSVLKEINTGLSFQPRKKGILVFHSAKPSGGINDTCSQMLNFPLAEACSTELVFTTRLHKGIGPGRAAAEAGQMEIRSLPEWGHGGCDVPGHRQNPCSSWLLSFLPHCSRPTGHARAVTVRQGQSVPKEPSQASQASLSNLPNST